MMRKQKQALTGVRPVSDVEVTAIVTESPQQQEQAQEQEQQHHQPHEQAGGEVNGGVFSAKSATCDPKERSDSSTLSLTPQALKSVGQHTVKSLSPEHIRRKACRTALIVLAISIAGGVAFLTYGIIQAQKTASQSFDTRATELAWLIETSWREYQNAALGIHNACRKSRNTTRQDFFEMYEYLVAEGLEFDAMECAPNITHAERPAYEQRSRQFYAQRYPEIDYQGIVGFVPDPNQTLSESDDPEQQQQYIVVPSPPRDFYVTVEHVEPVLVNAPAIDLDMYSHPPQRREIDMAITTRQPVISKRLHLVQETVEFSYSVIIYHPGIFLETRPDDRPDVLSLIVVRMPSLLQRVAKLQQENLAVYLYDTSPLNTQGTPEFLGAGLFTIDKGHPSDTIHKMTTIPEIDYHTFRAQQRASGGRLYERVVPITPSGTWIVAVVPVDRTFDPAYTYVLFGGAMILVAGIVVATWIYRNAQRDAMMNEERVAAEAERAALIVKNAEEAAQTERELNDFLAHEVRNPLAAAISATSFLCSAVNEAHPLSTPKSITSVREDVNVIKSSLQYANDLLRNMLDMHKASCEQLHLTMHPASLRKDILEPVATILCSKKNNFVVEVECDNNLAIQTDRIRLKQIVINLASNSCKFVEKGFIRIGAKVVQEDIDGTNRTSVIVYVEDSGPGIPADKRENLFEKFQSSLDCMSQGTGIGLSLCKTLANLLGGEVMLDQTYHSGIEGCPGARFVVRLDTRPLDLQATYSGWIDDPEAAVNAEEQLPELPTEFCVLFVDDDMILRKLFSRAVKRVAPTWHVNEAANGETALRLIDEHEHYDLIFLDQYMASVQKQLLGTETVRALRSKGFSGKICGLSANSMEEAFLDAGADAFMFKPFPCETLPLKRELLRVIYPELDL